MKIVDFLQVIEKMPKRSEGKSILNPSQHFIRLCESHELTMDNDVVDFFELLQSEDFFAEVNMPKDWGIRSYASALKSIQDILLYDKVKDILDIDIEEMSQYIDKQRKYYNNIYKKQQRQKIAEKSNAVSKVLRKEKTGTTREVDVYEGNPVVSTNSKIDDDSDEEPHILYADPYMETKKQDNINDSMYMDDSDHIDGRHEEKYVPHQPQPQQKHNQHQIQYIISLLEKYMQHETDEFKKVYLEVVIDQILMLDMSTVPQMNQ